MAFNKTKALESALKFLNQGKVAQAIGEYQQILRHDPKDQATLMTVGDLFARQGDMSQAVEYFERLAQVYLGDGFNSKAIAIYKKIAKLAPNELPPLERLADLYVQQGVLSEARPLFLQIAEAHLKANHAPKAIEVLQRLLDVEPDNPRVQMRLAELYNVMGQKKEAAHVYFNYGQRLHEQGQDDEAEKLIERALAVDGANAAAILLKAKILAAANKNEQAISILEHHAEADAGGEVTKLLVDLELKAGQYDKAADRGRNQLVRGSSHSTVLQKVAESMIEAGRPKEALTLLRELRDPLIEASEHDKFVKLLNATIEKMPGAAEPLELLADFARHTSDPFQVSSALGGLVDIYAEAGNFSRAQELMEELVDRNKDDERLVAKLEQLRARSSGKPVPAANPVPPPTVADVISRETPPAAEVKPEVQSGAAAPPVAEEPLDDETQRYIAQALTDVDLFSSYGLTQKATQLLENVLQKAPRHTPTLERLLDLCLGAGEERRTAELAAQLEQIYKQRGDTVGVERFTELRQRFQKVAGLTEEELAATTLAAQRSEAAAPGPSSSLATVEEPEPKVAPSKEAAPGPVEFEIPLTPFETEPAGAQNSAAMAPPTESTTPAEPQPAAATEVDLSDEWEAMVQEVGETGAKVSAEASAIVQPPEPEAIPIEGESITIEEESAASAESIPESASEQPAAIPTFEFDEERVRQTPASETAPAETADFELELAPEPGVAQGKTGAQTTEDFLSELASEVEDMEAPVADSSHALASAQHSSAIKQEADVVPIPEAAPEVTASKLNELAEVFQEFRDELGEMGDEEEDLETHYNLGIAYREMGLLDEAIGEFQKVAKAVQQGKPFPYAMNCSALLALSFMDKNEPKIAALWYKRALDLPRLEQETVLALRYDLGIALDMAGETDAALDSFRQVYAMNIDYRDVADRIAMLQKH